MSRVMAGLKRYRFRKIRGKLKPLDMFVFTHSPHCLHIHSDLDLQDVESIKGYFPQLLPTGSSLACSFRAGRMFCVRGTSTYSSGVVAAFLL